VTEELHVVDVKRSEIWSIWQVSLSNRKVMHVSAFDHPDELSAYVYATNRLKEQANGNNSRA
jgi:hypothetical protein